MTEKQIIEQAVQQAQETARSEGLVIGSVVAHPDDLFTYKLLKVEGDTAYVRLSADKSPNGKELRKTFPVNELFNPVVANNYAIQINAELMMFNPN